MDKIQQPRQYGFYIQSAPIEASFSGVTIGDQVLIGAGSVVTHDIPSQSLVAGNPARVLLKIHTALYGQIFFLLVGRTVKSNEFSSPIS